MKPTIIVITGCHRLIRKSVETVCSSYTAISYLTAIEDFLREQYDCAGWDCNAGFDEELMRQEFSRDAIIMNNLAQCGHHLVFVEQWHLGNIAAACARGSSCALEYSGAFKNLLEGTRNWAIQALFVSSDLDKLSGEVNRKFYQAYCGELSSVIDHYKLPLDPLDGEANSRNLDRRLQSILRGFGYLLDTSIC